MLLHETSQLYIRMIVQGGNIFILDILILDKKLSQR